MFQRAWPKLKPNVTPGVSPADVCEEARYLARAAFGTISEFLHRMPVKYKSKKTKAK